MRENSLDSTELFSLRGWANERMRKRINRKEFMAKSSSHFTISVRGWKKSIWWWLCRHVKERKSFFDHTSHLVEVCYSESKWNCSWDISDIPKERTKNKWSKTSNINKIYLFSPSSYEITNFLSLFLMISIEMRKKLSLCISV
jgi:hypothetical protein